MFALFPLQKLGQFVAVAVRLVFLLVPAPSPNQPPCCPPFPLCITCVCVTQKVGQFVAVAVGLVFLLVQGLAYTGFITVQWTKVHGAVLDVLDVNKDGWVPLPM